MLCIITGGGGFIGRHLSQELLNAGYRVRVLDRLDAQVHGDAQPPEEAEGSRVELVRADVRDGAAVRRALEGADVVVHLAAQVGVGQSMYEIDEYVGTNDHGTAVLLQALIEQPVRRIVVASSMSVYGEGRYRDEAGHPVAARRRRPADLSAGRWDAVTDGGRGGGSGSD
jgi:dTDP-L-rhamnose 4-epimerase